MSQLYKQYTRLVIRTWAAGMCLAHLTCVRAQHMSPHGPSFSVMWTGLHLLFQGLPVLSSSAGLKRCPPTQGMSTPRQTQILEAGILSWRTCSQNQENIQGQWTRRNMTEKSIHFKYILYMFCFKQRFCCISIIPKSGIPNRTFKPVRLIQEGLSLKCSKPSLSPFGCSSSELRRAV